MPARRLGFLFYRPELDARTLGEKGDDYETYGCTPYHSEDRDQWKLFWRIGDGNAVFTSQRYRHYLSFDEGGFLRFVTRLPDAIYCRPERI